jgi:RimJ/RimL family protein N-acetyltransferase
VAPEQDPPVAESSSRPKRLAEWPAAPLLSTERLSLEPLTPGHAEEMAPLLDDPALYAFTGGRPLTLDELRRRYADQARGRSPDGTQRWLNWIVRGAQSGQPLGTVQATVAVHGESFIADLAWLIAAPHQGRGYATEAATAMAGWLRAQGADVLAANIHPRHDASMRVARALALTPTEEHIGGEVRWSWPPAQGLVQPHA